LFSTAPRASHFTLAIALLATAALSARFQDPPQPTFRGDASYVRVDVYPTIDGAPVADLTRDDFEVFEDNKLQTVSTFEHVTTRGWVPQEQRAEPNTVAQSRELLQNPRSRVFAIFLDTLHVDVDGSRNIRRPLVTALDRLIGPDDLVGVMTPEMSAADLTFARRTTTIEGFLARNWDWGQRNRTIVADPVEQAYQVCYPGALPNPCKDDRGIADQMILRRREKVSLDAIEDLLRYLGSVRDERTAIIVISDGWLLYRPDASLSRRLNKCDSSASQPVGLDPRTGRLAVGTAPSAGADFMRCEADRVSLAQMDDATRFQVMLDRANRSNVSFYPVDPRGLAVFDTAIDTPRTGLPPDGPLTTPVAQDAAMLRARQFSLRDLAAATDGVPVINTSDLEGGFRRITADLSSYYLLGYYSTGKLDGKFHAITVRVKRPGVQVRARRGYLALTAAEAAAPRGPNPAVPNASASATTAGASAIAAALATLGTATRDARLHLSYAVTSQPPTVWTAGEFNATDEWRQGAEVDLTLATSDGRMLSAGHERVAPGFRSFRSVLRPSTALAPGDYVIRVRATPLGMNPEPLTEVLQVAVAGSSSGVLIARRGVTTGNREVPAADLRFRRSEQLRVEVPSPASNAATARLLDRAGQPMTIPVAAAERTDGDGSRWISAVLSLAPLAAGDYVMEISRGAMSDTNTTLVAFRVMQ
jgi:VWFA-related protein